MEINIDTKNLHEFDELAYMLDPDNTIDAIKELRKCWKIPQKLVPYVKFDKWFDENKDNLYFVHEAIDQLDWVRDQLYMNYQHKSFNDYEVRNKEVELNKIYDNPYKFQIEFTSRKIGIAGKWRNLMLKAIICGKVTSKEYQEAKEQTNKYEYNEWLFEDVTIAPARIYKGTKRSKKKIERDRDWRFDYINIKTKHPNKIGIHGIILDEWNKNCWRKKFHDNNKECKHCIFATTTIEQAISRYNRFLQS